MGTDELIMSRKQSIRNEQDEADILEDQNSQSACSIMYCGHSERVFLDPVYLSNEWSFPLIKG